MRPGRRFVTTYCTLGGGGALAAFVPWVVVHWRRLYFVWVCCIFGGRFVPLDRVYLEAREQRGKGYLTLLLVMGMDGGTVQILLQRRVWNGRFA